ncbi:MAG: phosphonoacetaldehyde reductase [Synergistaceae bacterium]|nr:phosphonoacetaldehyde reductase [Synergistaceae bacterium]
MQKILSGYDALSEYLSGVNAESVLFVHGRSLEKFTDLRSYLSFQGGIHFEDFTGFTPNPKLDDAENAVKYADNCNVILAVGGGSAIDTAKYVKLKSPDLPLIVIPTTAGSGSEATRFAVLYKDGRKLSITDDRIIPDAVMFDPELLKYLPEYHRKSSALDAMSHALESFWSVNANDKSREFSREALSSITGILEDYPYSYNAERMLKSSYTAGRAINISQTTAGHAMCYKITGIFGTAHGHSAAMCNRVLFRWLCDNSELDILSDIASSMGCDSPYEASEKFERIFFRLNLNIPEASGNDIEALTNSVNPERLKNFPVNLDTETIRKLYCKILNVKE